MREGLAAETAPIAPEETLTSQRTRAASLAAAVDAATAACRAAETAATALRQAATSTAAIRMQQEAAARVAELGGQLDNVRSQLDAKQAQLAGAPDRDEIDRRLAEVRSLRAAAAAATDAFDRADAAVALLAGERDLARRRRGRCGRRPAGDA